MSASTCRAWASHAEPATGAGDDRDALVTGHLDLVDRIVAEMAGRFPRHVERDELWNAGALGLVEAAERFDPQRGVPFPRFAAVRVRGAIMDATRSRDWASRGLRRTARAVDAARESAQQRLGRTPSDAEVGAELGVEASAVHAHRSAAQQAELLQLEQPLGGDDEPWTLGELVTEVTEERVPEEALLHRELIGTLRAAVAHLPQRLAYVIERYYERGECLTDIAESLEVTEARASQLRGEAIAALRAYLADQFAAPGVDPAAPGARGRAAYVDRMAATSWAERFAAADAGGLAG